MKHLLIIISFLLLSSPVIGDNHKGETLYGWITSSSTLEWKGFGDKETHPIYKGDVCFASDGIVKIHITS